MKTGRSTTPRAPHAFQDLHRRDSRSKPKHRESDRAFFQPMFKKGTQTIASNAFVTPSNREDNQEDPHEHARRQGYQRGVRAGKQNACQLVKSEITPALENLASAIQLCHSRHQALIQEYSNTSVKLALDIVEKICGSPARSVSLDDLDSVRRAIMQTMEQSYQIKVSIHPTDMTLMRELSSCEDDFAWEQYTGISIGEDDSVPSGRAQHNRSDFAPEEILQTLALILNKMVEKHRIGSDDTSFE